MTTYRRRKDKDTWHWCTNCSNYPRNPDDVTETKPDKERPDSGELCNECRGKEDKGNCTP